MTKKFKSRYPKRQSGVEHTQYPHCDDWFVFIKERISTKLNRLKTNFRKAVDSGRKSGGGRTVLGLYDECYAIWAGSRAVESVDRALKALQLIEICQKFAEHISDTTSDTLSRSISPFAEADDEEKSDEVTGKTSQCQGELGEFRRNLMKHLQQRKSFQTNQKKCCRSSTFRCCQYTCHVLGYVSIFILFVLQSQPKS